MYQQIKFRLIRLGACCLFCLLLAGCSQQEQADPKAPRTADKAVKLTIGLIPEQDVFAQKKYYQPLMAYLSRQIGVPIEIRILSRYGNIIDSFNDLGLDGAFFGSFTGALAIRKLQVEPVARPQHSGGSSTYYGMVFVRKGSGIRSAMDMKGKRMVFVDKATTAGYLLPLSYFRTHGIADYRTWFSEVYFSGTHEDAIYDVLNGSADIGAAKNTIFYRLAREDNRISRELEILTTSPHVPANALALRHDLANELKQAFKKALLDMHRQDEGRKILDDMHMEKFIATTVEDYRPVIDYAENIGLDLKTYNYLNN